MEDIKTAELLIRLRDLYDTMTRMTNGEITHVTNSLISGMNEHIEESFPAHHIAQCLDCAQKRERIKDEIAFLKTFRDLFTDITPTGRELQQGILDAFIKREDRDA